MKKKQIVLIVDDNLKGVKILAELLADDKDISLSFASNAEKAFESIVFKKPDLILMDVLMPGMNGYEACAKIKENPDLKDIPVIFLTGKAEAEDTLEGFKAGGVDYIAKPYDPQLVRARVHNHLRLKQANDEIKKLYEDLKETEKVKNALSNMIVHDLRNPISVIGATLDLIAMTGESWPEKILRKRTIIEKAVEEAINLVNVILDISKMEDQTMKIYPTLFSPSDLIKEVAVNTNALCKMQGVKLDLIVKNKNLKINTDKELVRRILENLLANALKFSQKGFSVELTLEKKDNNVIYKVNDHGPGVPPEFRKKIFDQFYQITSQAVKSRVGVGLGLAFCHMAADTIGGKIWVEDRSDAKSGSSFCLALPLTKT